MISNSDTRIDAHPGTLTDTETDTPIDPSRVIYDAPVLIRKEALFQRLADYCRQGYHYAVSGTVPINRAPALAYKFKTLYHVHADKNERYRRKRVGIGNAELFLYAPDETNTDIVWVLLATAGHISHQTERLTDVREKGGRLFVTGYEMVRLPRHGSSAPAYTWRISDEQFHTWKYRLRTLIRSRADGDLQRAYYGLTHPPGFRAIRQQTRVLIAYAKAEWKRSRNKNEPWPIYGSIRIPYLRRIAHQTRPLTALLRKRLADRTKDNE